MITQKEIIEYNILISEYMDESNDKEYYFFSFLNNDFRTGYMKKNNFMNFHNSWKWLMPVVEKIGKNYDVQITWMPTAINTTGIDRPDSNGDEISSMGGMTVMENTYLAVVNFIKWYNTKSPNRKKQ